VNILTLGLSWCITTCVTLGAAWFLIKKGHGIGKVYGPEQYPNKDLERLISDTPPINKIQIVCSGFPAKPWNQDGFKEWIKSSLENNVKIQLLLGQYNSEMPDFIKKWIKDGKIQARKVDDRITFHYILVDGNRGHIEEYHNDPEPAKGTTYVKRFYPEVLKEIQREFADNWKQAKNIGTK
jgi:hypothetical protein